MGVPKYVFLILIPMSRIIYIFLKIISVVENTILFMIFFDDFNFGKTLFSIHKYAQVLNFVYMFTRSLIS